MNLRPPFDQTQVKKRIEEEGPSAYAGLCKFLLCGCRLPRVWTWKNCCYTPPKYQGPTDDEP